MAKFDRDKLTSAVYSATISSDNLDETLDNIDALILGVQHDAGISGAEISDIPDGRGFAAVDPDLAKNIQLRFGRHKTNAQRHINK